MNNLRVNLLLDGRLSLVVLCLLVIQRSCPFHCAVYVSAFQPSLLRGSSPFVRPSNKSTCFLLGVRGNEQCPPAYSSPLFSRHIEDPAPSPLVVGRPVVFDKSCAKHRKSRSRALSLSSLSSGDDIKLNKNGILAFLRRVLFWPLKQLIIKPLKWLAEQVVDSLDQDETAPVMDNDTGRLQSTSSETSLEVSDVADRTQEPSIIESAAGGELSKDTKVSKVSKNPKGNRWAVAAPGVDLTGHWSLIVTDEFKRDYDRYLEGLQQPFLVRSMAVGLLSMTTDECNQKDGGKSLLIHGRNARGVWDRTLIASGTEVGVPEYTPLSVPVMSAESEQVLAESWWEENGTVHVSWLRGVNKYGGGAFESRRYLEDNGKIYVCETTFHRQDADKGDNDVKIAWRFRRQAETS